MHRLRLALVALAAAILLPACVTLDGAGQTINQAQLQALQYQRDIASIQAADRADARSLERERIRAAADTVKEFAKFHGSGNDLVSAWAIASGERVALSQLQPRAAPTDPAAASRQQPPQATPDGPIVSAVKAIAPFVLPIAQIWQADRQGARSLTQAVANMDLIGTLSGQIHRDPLVVETPPAQVITAPDPVILTPPDPIVIEIEHPAPIVLPAGGA